MGCESVWLTYGELAERSIAPVSNTGVPEGTRGSNPLLSAVSMEQIRTVRSLVGSEVQG